MNGKEARARDVQTLFADLASGARASAMVSQGRVGALVNANPAERRALLEEAAGITGLHARRHEAELKLGRPSRILTRADDLKGQIEARLAELKRQARQASRYRNLSGAIRTAEAELLSILRAKADADRAASEAPLRRSEVGSGAVSDQSAYSSLRGRRNALRFDSKRQEAGIRGRAATLDGFALARNDRPFPFARSPLQPSSSRRD